MILMFLTSYSIAFVFFFFETIARCFLTFLGLFSGNLSYSSSLPNSLSIRCDFESSSQPKIMHANLTFPPGMIVIT